MSYQLKRINPFWYTHPMIPTAVVIGGIVGLVGYKTQNLIVAGIGAVVASLAILAAARPVVSALLATLGLLGGLVTFVIVPGANVMGMGLGQRMLSVLLFALFYMVLMDALVLVVSVLYNLFAGVVGLGGLRLEFESAEEEPTA